MLSRYLIFLNHRVTVKQTKLNDFISFISARRRAAALEERCSNLTMMNLANGGKHVTIITFNECQSQYITFNECQSQYICAFCIKYIKKPNLVCKNNIFYAKCFHNTTINAVDAV